MARRCVSSTPQHNSDSGNPARQGMATQSLALWNRPAVIARRVAPTQTRVVPDVAENRGEDDYPHRAGTQREEQRVVDGESQPVPLTACRHDQARFDSALGS